MHLNIMPTDSELLSPRLWPGHEPPVCIYMLTLLDDIIINHSIDD